MTALDVTFITDNNMGLAEAAWTEPNLEKHEDVNPAPFLIIDANTSRLSLVSMN